MNGLKILSSIRLLVQTNVPTRLQPSCRRLQHRNRDPNVVKGRAKGLGQQVTLPLALSDEQRGARTRPVRTAAAAAPSVPQGTLPFPHGYSGVGTQ
jgi:hypothetical protein